MEQMLFLVPVVGLLGLLFAVILRQQIVKEDPGTDRMREIADAIAEGANAFLASEYRILVVFVAVLFFVIGFGTRNWITAGCFLVGSGFSTMAGYLGMNAAIRANSRTADAARTSGMHRALALAFSGGSVMGMAVVGLGLLGVGVLYILTRDVSVLSGFSLGASSIALFARVGGGIYTKAADVGADLVGKVEAGIPEDDPRNPAVIADNVGDNVGDVAGMGADLFESYVGSLISALTLGLVFYQEAGIVFPLMLSACGIIAAIIGSLLVKSIGNSDPHKALKTGEYSATALVVVCSLVLSRIFFGNFMAANKGADHYQRLSFCQENSRAVRNRLRYHHHQRNCRGNAVNRGPHPAGMCGCSDFQQAYGPLRNCPGSRRHAVHHWNHRCH